MSERLHGNTLFSLVVIALLATGAMARSTEGMRAGTGSNYVLVEATRVDDFHFTEAEFFLFVLIHVPDIDPTGVIVTTDSGLIIEFDSPPGDDDWDAEVDFADLALLRAAMDSQWTISISGPSPSESTFAIDASGFQESDFYDTPTDVFPANGSTGVPPDVILSWSDPTGDATADILLVFVGSDEETGEQEDDNIFGTLDIADTTWDPPLDLSAGFNEFSVFYLDIDDAQLVTPLVVQEGKIAWANSPYAPKGYPAMTPLLELGSQTIVGFEVGKGDTCPADLDDSGAVDFGDILAILSAWGNAGGPEDLDGSGTVDFGDILVVLEAWGPCP